MKCGQGQINDVRVRKVACFQVLTNEEARQSRKQVEVLIEY